MAEQYDTPDPELVKGFNEGYTLAKHLPELSEQLNKADIASARGEGFQAGRQQVALEYEQNRQPRWMHPDFVKPKPDGPTTNTQRDRDLEVKR